MRNLAEDLDEVQTDAEKRWVRRARREAGLGRDDPSVWIAHRYNDRDSVDRSLEAIGGSPGDVIATCEMSVPDEWSGSRQGTGYWIIERLGGEDGTIVLRISCSYDEQEAL